MRKRIYKFIWQLAERFGLDLGRFGPYVVAGMSGRKGKKVRASKARRPRLY